MNKAKTTRLIQDVKFLTELRPFRNYQNLDSLKKVADYIKKEMSMAGFDDKSQ